jgi:O-antigen ligase
VTVIYSLSPLYSGARLIESVLAMVTLAACALEVRQSEDVSRLLLHFLLACGVILILLAMSAVLMPHSVAWASPEESYTARELANYAKSGLTVEGLNRFRGMLNNPNDVGALMLIVVGSAFVRWPSAQGRERLILATMIIASLLFDFLADSRSPLVAIGLGCALYAIWKWGLRGILLCVGVLVIAVAVVSFHSGLSVYIERGDVSTLTGRTDIWEYVLQQIKARPFLGYGYETGGTVFQSRDFPLWWGPWDLGPHSSLHNGYLGHALGLGIPATILWLYIVLRPWVFALRQPNDPWNLKPMIFFIVVPVLVNNFSEQALGDFGGGVIALLFGLTWVVAERSRVLALEKVRVERERAQVELPRAVAALSSAQWAQASRF